MKNGGVLVTTYWSGIADDTDRCFLNGTPHDLMDVLGIRSTEIDGLYDWEENQMVPEEGNELGLTRSYTCRYLCDLVEMRGARTLMTYGSDFYKGYSALTANDYGKGSAWYVAADGEQAFYEDFIRALLKHCSISGAVECDIPCGLEITTREKEGVRYYLYQNFGTEPVKIPIPEADVECIYGDMEKELPVYELAVLKQKI